MQPLTSIMASVHRSDILSVHSIRCHIYIRTLVLLLIKQHIRSCLWCHLPYYIHHTACLFHYDYENNWDWLYDRVCMGGQSLAYCGCNNMAAILQILFSNMILIWANVTLCKYACQANSVFITFCNMILSTLRPQHALYTVNWAIYIE